MDGVSVQNYMDSEYSWLLYMEVYPYLCCKKHLNIE